MMPEQPQQPILHVDGLSIDIANHFGNTNHNGDTNRVLDDVSFSIAPGEVTALVGESGSGKTLTGRAILRLLPGAASIAAGDIQFNGQSVRTMSDTEIRQLRGRHIGMIFQEPMVSLNPAHKIGVQMSEVLKLHEGISDAKARQRCVEMLEKVKMPRPHSSLNAYPHEFSGGMRQRIMLASTLVMRPKLLIADEPTTALDALICKEVMELMLAMTREIGAALLLISHDLSMVARYASQAVVMKKGNIIDKGNAQEVLLRPRHAYTQALMQALPTRNSDSKPASADEPLIRVKDLHIDYKGKVTWFRKRPSVKAVNGVSFDIGKGETLALVGESGSGKTSIGHALLRLNQTSAGSIYFDGRDLATLDKQSLAELRNKTQIVFQDPFSSLDPRMRLGQVVAEGLRHIDHLSRAEKAQRTRSILEEVGLPGDYIHRFAHELSGGQRQRVCIARSVVANPAFIVADEPVSALDVTVQRQVLSLMADLQNKYGYTCLLVSHDLAVIEQMADRVAVMYMGQLLEMGPRDAIFDNPCHPYTRRLLDATPRVVPDADGYSLVTTANSLQHAPRGFHFFNNGCIAGATINHIAPIMVEVGTGHSVCCVKR